MFNLWKTLFTTNVLTMKTPDIFKSKRHRRKERVVNLATSSLELVIAVRNYQLCMEKKELENANAQLKNLLLQKELDQNKLQLIKP